MTRSVTAIFAISPACSQLGVSASTACLLSEWLLGCKHGDCSGKAVLFGIMWLQCSCLDQVSVRRALSITSVHHAYCEMTMYCCQPGCCWQRCSSNGSPEKGSTPATESCHIPQLPFQPQSLHFHSEKSCLIANDRSCFWLSAFHLYCSITSARLTMFLFWNICLLQPCGLYISVLVSLMSLTLYVMQQSQQSCSPQNFTVMTDMT